MLFDSGDGSGIRRLSEDERMRLLREEEEALGMYHSDDTVYLPALARLAEAAQGGAVKAAIAAKDRDPLADDGPVDYLAEVGEVSV